MTEPSPEPGVRVMTDTNVFLRAFRKGDSQHGVASEAVERLHDQGCMLCVVPQVLVEARAVMTRPLDVNGWGMTMADAAVFSARVEAMFVLLTTDEASVHEHWRRIVEHVGASGKQVHDARLVASMRAHGVTHILTFDDRFARYGVHVLDPSTVASPA